MLASITALRDDPDLLTRRGRAGVTALSACPEVDGCLAAVGFCFGGMSVLTLARTGVALAGAISMHGRSRTPGSSV